MGHNRYSGLLYSETSFLEGVGRALDIFGAFDHDCDSASPEEADRIALASDWYAVGADLHHAILSHVSKSRNGSSHGGRISSGGKKTD